MLLSRALGVMSASNATYFPFAATGVSWVVILHNTAVATSIDTPLKTIQLTLTLIYIYHTTSEMILCIYKVTFTALCVRLLNEGRLDELLLKVCSDWLEKGGVTTTTPVPNKEGMRLIDGVYVELYTAFGDFWISQMPSSIMEFPKVRGYYVALALQLV